MGSLVLAQRLSVCVDAVSADAAGAAVPELVRTGRADDVGAGCDFAWESDDAGLVVGAVAFVPVFAGGTADFIPVLPCAAVDFAPATTCGAVDFAGGVTTTGAALTGWRVTTGGVLIDLFADGISALFSCFAAGGM